MKKKEMIEDLYNGILALDEERATAVAKEVVKSNMKVIDAIEMGMAPAMKEVGRRFEAGDAFLPELMLSAKVFKAAVDILQEKLTAADKKARVKGRVLIGTVKGDIHTIGKNLVGVMLKVAGFEVIDIGSDQPALTFIEEAQGHEVDIIGLSALMSTTMPQQREVIEALKSEGLREKFIVIVGGASVRQEWADEIGADGYAENATQAVELVKELL